MRFMGFSMSYFPVRFAALALVGAFVASLGVVALPSEAEAARRNVWSVKFKCSIDAVFGTNTVRLDTTFFTGDFFVQTIVNIHNPTGRDSRFKKNFVIMAPQHVSEDPAVSSQSSAITLNANEGHAIDCEDIITKLTFDVADEFDQDVKFVEGWVVIESDRGNKNPDLAVCANYFLISDETDTPTGLNSDVVCIDPIRARFKDSDKF